MCLLAPPCAMQMDDSSRLVVRHPLHAGALQAMGVVVWMAGQGEPSLAGGYVDAWV